MSMPEPLSEPNDTPAMAAPSRRSPLERLFRLREHQTDVRTEILAGVTTFLTMAYIIFVNPNILGDAGMPKGAVFVATCLVAAIGSLVMAFYANYPIALAPGMGLNAYFAFGVVGGYIASTEATVDFVRSCGSGFIFSTSMPPAIAAAALASIRHVSGHPELRVRHQERAATLKRRLTAVGLPVMPSVTHIVPVLVGDAALCKQASDLLMDRHSIYVQPINYPTVPKGTERLRFTPSPNHTDAMMDHLVQAMDKLFSHCNVARRPVAA